MLRSKREETKVNGRKYWEKRWDLYESVSWWRQTNASHHDEIDLAGTNAGQGDALISLPIQILMLKE